MTLMRHSPLRELDQLLESFDALWSQNAPTNTQVTLDIFERDGALFVRAPMPGIKPEDIEIAVERDVLTLRAEFKSDWETEDAKVYRRESQSGRFARSIRLPNGLALDQIDATFDHGVVQVRIPKLGPDHPDVRRIPIRTNESSPALESSNDPR